MEHPVFFLGFGHPVTIASKVHNTFDAAAASNHGKGYVRESGEDMYKQSGTKQYYGQVPNTRSFDGIHSKNKQSHEPYS